MEKVFVDTNIILDWLGKRAPFDQAANRLFSLGEAGEVELLVSTMSLIPTEYILRKQIGKENARLVLAAMRTICTVCASGEKEIDLSISHTGKDFEDGFQYYTAIHNGAGVIITRNTKDFAKSSLPIMSAETYLKSRTEQEGG
jgi:predicted nucleic acid-binding protein